MDERAADHRTIRDIIDRQFASLCWLEGGAPDAAMFKGDVLPGAPLYPSARPVVAMSAHDFTERMGELARTTLTSFHERAIGTRITIFGTIAVAVAVNEFEENEGQANRTLEMLLLVKSEGRWKIAGQAWDKETSTTPIPDEFLGHR